jgi:hypothetical protein
MAFKVQLPAGSKIIIHNNVCLQEQQYCDHIKESEMSETRGKYGGQGKCVQVICGGKLNKTDHLEKLGVDWTTILKRILQKRNRIAWTAFSWLRTETSSGNFETR